MKYGDRCYFKSGDMYLKVPDPSVVGKSQPPLTQDGTTGDGTTFEIYDRFGQGLNIDWAQQGKATQSSTYGSYYPQNLIDGIPSTFNHTNKGTGQWIQVRLSEPIMIEKVVITNRKSSDPDVVNRLKQFDVRLMDNNDKLVVEKYYPNTQAVYTWDNISRVARTVKVQLRPNDYLHLGNLSVYGIPADHARSNPTVSNILTKEISISNSNLKSIYNESLPPIRVVIITVPIVSC